MLIVKVSFVKWYASVEISSSVANDQIQNHPRRWLQRNDDKLIIFDR